MTRALGYLRDHHDDRDYRLGAVRHAVQGARPERTHNFELLRRWRDQRTTSACVGHAVATHLELVRASDGLKDTALSALHCYANARLVGRLGLVDGGSRIRDALQGAVKLGVTTQDAWPTVPARVNDRPPAEVEMRAVGFRGYEYRRLPGRGETLREAVLDALTVRPGVVVGKTVCQSFMDHSGDGVLHPPKAGEREVGGHATVYLDYRSGGRELLECNSWEGWGFGRDSVHGGRVESLAWVSSDFLTHWTMGDVWTVVPKSARTILPPGAA